MNVRGWIADQKAKHQRHLEAVQRSELHSLQRQKFELEEKRRKEGELLKARAEKARVERDVENIRKARVTPQKESRLKNLGKGLVKHMKEQKANRPSVKVKAIPSSGSRGLQVGRSDGSSPFGGTRNLDVGGSGSSSFSFGPSEKKKQ